MFRILVAIILALFIYSNWTLWRDKAIEGIKDISIEQGASVTNIINQLEAEEIIHSASFTRLYLALTGNDVNIQAGNYSFSGEINLRQVLEILKGGAEGKKEITVTFIEGWDIDEMATYLSEQNIVTEREFLKAVDNSYDVSIIDSVPRSRDDLEGYLFPDTYNIFANVTAEELVEKMLKNLEVKINEDLLSEIKRQGKTVDEIIIMASILEKELIKADEKKIGAGVLYNRLENGIALQVDSSVNYITGKNTPRASFKDLEVDSPYNTYKYRGLPPGPISNPGLESIEAAIYPEEHNYLYFLTTPEGSAIFNQTLEGHNASKAKYY